MKFLVIGDSCLDVFVYGEVDRLAPEAPVPVIVPLFQKQNLGMASNVAENLRALGAEVNLITNLEQIRKVRYVDSRYNQMIMRVDENDKCQRISVDFNDLKEYDAIVVSDYCKGFLLEEDIQKIIQVASCPVFLDTKKNLGDWCKDVDFIKINNQEFQNNLKNIEKNPSLKKKLIITKGKNGCEYGGILYPTKEVPVKDVSGAGDTFIAGLVVKYHQTQNIIYAIQFAQQCTTIVVQKQGVATV